MSSLDPKRFEGTIDGKEVKLYCLRNKRGNELCLINQGAKLVALTMPSREGKKVDLLLGHDSLQDYIDSEEQYFGALCGRFANRIAQGKFSLDGKSYQLACNNGPNSLHGGIKAFNSVVWDAEQLSANRIKLSYLSPDGEEGFPGNLQVELVYMLSDDDELIVEIKAESDKATPINLTNHSYFNLSGHGVASIHDHILEMAASRYLPTDHTAIPVGAPQDLTDTPMDFRKASPIGARIDEDFEQLKIGRGYDHCYVLDKKEAELGFAARCTSPQTGITMEVYTDQPAVQLYTGNWMTGNMRGKYGERYPAQSALCLETQHFPDNPNRPDYPSCILRPGEVFESTTVFRFFLSETEE